MNRLMRLRGEEVGRDGHGNRYLRAPAKGGGERRWVRYARGRGAAPRLGRALRRGEVPPLPPSWRAWLHRTVDAPPSGAASETGAAAPRRLPPGLSGRRPRAVGDWTAWTPGGGGGG